MLILLTRAIVKIVKTVKYREDVTRYKVYHSKHIAGM